MISLKVIYEDIVQELIVHGDVNTGKYLVAYKEGVWLLADDRTEVPEDLKAKLNINAKFITWETVNIQAEEDPNIITGTISDDKILYTSNPITTRDPKTSLSLKKIVNQLKLKGVSYSSAGGDEEYTTPKSKMKGQVIDTAYHGTSSKYLSQIARTGLKPGESPSNYPRVITHGELVFFTSKIDEALYHAAHTADKTKSIPLILELKIPDKNKLVPDYDIAAKASGNRELSQGHYSDLQQKKQPRQLSQETGIWGYKGRIPANFIKYVYVPKDWLSIAGTDKIHYLTTKDYKKMNLRSAVRYIQKLEDYGY